MIVIINSFPFPGVAKIGSELAERYEKAGFVDIHTLVTAEKSRGTTLPFPLDPIGQRVSSFKQHGSQHVVINYTFETPGSLKQLRVFLSQYDDEIYAFCLRFNTAILAELLETTDNPDEISEDYSHWLKKQD